MQCALDPWISYGKPGVCGLFSRQAAKMVTLLTLPVALGASHLELAVPADTGLRTLKRRLLRSLLKAPPAAGAAQHSPRRGPRQGRPQQQQQPAAE